MLILTLDIPPMASQGAKGMRIVSLPGRKPFIQVYETKELREWKSKVAQHTWAAMKSEHIPKLTGAIRIVCLVYQFAPTIECDKKYHNNLICGRQVYKATTPDIVDNLQKGFIDAIKGILFDDDCKIVHMGDVWKCYGTKPQITLIVDTVTDMIVPQTVDEIIAQYTNKLTGKPPVIT